MTATEQEPEELDVLVVGAGISGIGAGRYLRVEHPSKSFAILEARSASGGTWDLFRYPGVRSDSDLHTFGYDFRPWRDRESIATSDRILRYLRETATESGLDPHVRYHHRVVAADWSSETARWLVEVERTDTGERLRLAARWIFCASGYYRYDEGYTPHLEGRDRFRGEVVHPQHWPDELDHAGKRVVVIGSGATAVTLVPALAETAAHVTMLQRTPTYVMPVPSVDRVALRLRRWFGEERGYAMTRRKNIAQQRAVWLFCQRFPKAARRLIRRVNTKVLPEGYPVDEHFSPPYDPWDQRLCAAPDGDFFAAIRAGTASVVTDRIATFTEEGLLLESGRTLEADLVVTATGLNLQVFGGIGLSVDGRPVSVPDTVVHRGMMLSGVPNFAIAIGYTNSSWTLKVGLLCEYFCRLLRHMDEHGHDTVQAEAPPGLPTRPLLDFGAGYVKRSLAELPRQGPQPPWVMSTGYHDDRRLLREGAVADEHLHFSGPRDRVAEKSRESSGGRVDPAAAPSTRRQEEPPGRLTGTRSSP
ncbi:flavin-containing monooxygenase [Nocardioides caldifontis]|uniref:flavin-containing monooxygenase n=1 Tax=Nocardioides caldifontis TaxID=2588938 RepID=UPI0011DF21AD|nr:NAD(P)/FAD-dependent oxidoreductase [Nocardioides caldifontis]